MTKKRKPASRSPRADQGNVGDGPLTLGQVARTTAHPGGPLVTLLDTTDRIAAWRLLALVTQAPPIPQALAEFNTQFMYWATNPTIDPDIAGLLIQAAVRISAGFRACITQAGPRNMDDSRFLMEVEHLLIEFAEVPDNLDEWRTLDPHMRNQNYGFGKLRVRREQRLGLPKDQVLPDRDEYALHSIFVHPRPAGELPQIVEDDENRLGVLLVDLLDLFGHAHRVWQAAGPAVEIFTSDLGQPSTNGGPLDPEPIQAVMKYRDEWQAGIQMPPRPDNIPIKHNLKDWIIPTDLSRPS